MSLVTTKECVQKTEEIKKKLEKHREKDRKLRNKIESIHKEDENLISIGFKVKQIETALDLVLDSNKNLVKYVEIVERDGVLEFNRSIEYGDTYKTKKEKINETSVDEVVDWLLTPRDDGELKTPSWRN